MKEYFKSSIQYYLRHLCDNRCLDPVREITTEFTDYLKGYITTEQQKYIEDNTHCSVQNKRTIEDIITLVKSVQVKREIDNKTMKLIEEGLKSLL